MTEKKTIPLSDEKSVRDVIVHSVFNLWKVVNDLTRLRPSKRDHYRVSIFGSARAKPESFEYEEVKKIAHELALMGCEIVTGGGPGLMQAANEGASLKGHSVGIRVDLPFEQTINPFVEEAFQHETFFSRLHHFALASDTFIIVPGGIGTTLEATMVWQLLQVNHLDRKIPLIFVGKMWGDFLEWAKNSFLPHQLANPEDLQIPYHVNTAEEAIAILKKYHDKWLNEK